MTRRQRERAVLELIQSQPIKNQQHLVSELLSRGLEVTQATVSRDIKRLGLVKVPQPDGSYRYASPQG
ncbi:MAG: arginine repressor, partial [Candidatus Eremiobacterota bacterium]